MVESTMQDFPLTVGMLFRHGRTVFGSSEVVTSEGATARRATFAEVGDRVDRLAAALHRLGIEAGDRVGTFSWNTQEHLEAYLAIPVMGAVLPQLKGKLDMLGAQLELRRSTLATSARAHDDEDDEAGVLYIEGQDDDDEGSEAELAALERPSKRSSKSQAQGEEYHTASESDESDDEAGAANGFAAHEGSMSAEEEDEEDAQNGMLDLEAEESDDGEEGSEDDDASEVSEDGDVETRTARRVRRSRSSSLSLRRSTASARFKKRAFVLFPAKKEFLLLLYAYLLIDYTVYITPLLQVLRARLLEIELL